MSLGYTSSSIWRNSPGAGKHHYAASRNRAGRGKTSLQQVFAIMPESRLIRQLYTIRCTVITVVFGRPRR
jgi:hypothetical protein